jgi:hypothetical protein
MEVHDFPKKRHPVLIRVGFDRQDAKTATTPEMGEDLRQILLASWRLVDRIFPRAPFFNRHC